MDELQFRATNEKLSKQYDLDEYLESSHSIIRSIAVGRIEYIAKIINKGDFCLSLDVGCGNGFLLKKLNMGRSVGIDLSANNIMKARNRLSNSRSCSLLQGNAENMSFGDSRFDCVVCSEVIEHVQHPEILLKETYRVLKPQGLFIVTVPNDALINRYKKILDVLSLTKLMGMKYGGGKEWHVHIFNKSRIERLLQKHGFHIKSAKKIPSAFLPLHYIFQCSKQ